MANQITMGLLLGYNDLFPDEPAEPRSEYAKLIGKEVLFKISAHFLSYFRLNAVPSNEQLFAEWFTFNEIKYYDVPFYHQVLTQYDKLKGQNGNMKILTIESFLKLFVWLNQQSAIPEKVENEGVHLTLPLFKLYLLFNDDVLTCYGTARNSIANFKDDRNLQRMILSNSFSQNDFLNADYAQLFVTQFYKAIKLLDFISSHAEYEPLFKKFLSEYFCGSKEEYLKSIGAAVVLPLQNRKPGWTILNVPQGKDYERDCAFLEKITVESGDTKLYEQNDYLSIRSNPLYRLQKGEYRVIYDLFLIKKVYTGLVFILSGLVRADKTLFNKDFLGSLRNEFSEGVLLYEILSDIYKPYNVIQKTGNEFKAAGLEREPDYYIRHDKTVLLFESKDFFIPGDVKLSYDFNKIEAALQNNRLEKAVKQLLKNIERILLKELVLDENYAPDEVTIYPVIVVYDALYSCPALNYWVHYWLDEGINQLKQEPKFKHFNFTKISAVTIVEIDTLILYREHFIQKELNLEELLLKYHDFVNFRNPPIGDAKAIEKHALQSGLPFSEFVRETGYQNHIQLNLTYLFGLFRQYGVS